MKGLTNVVKPFLQDHGRVQLNTILRYVMNSGRVNEDGVDFRTEKYKADIVSALNQADFYAVGDGVFVYVDDLSTEECERISSKLLRTANSLSRTARRMRSGQISFNPETLEFNIPEPIKVG